MQVSDWTLLLSLAGLLLAVVDVELCATGLPAESFLVGVAMLKKESPFCSSTPSRTPSVWQS